MSRLISECPYKGLPDHAYWKRAVATVAPRAIDPVVAAPLKITSEDRVASAGSCFAQHIAHRLQEAGYNYFVTEAGYERMPESLRRRYSYGVFSARYGNVYTARQLVQLFDRAYGTFDPSEGYWEGEGGYVDPFRPFIQPGGFATLAELRLDQQHHFAAVRRMFEELDVLVFTLGLTEAWVSKRDGAVFPVCPGCGAGQFDPERYEFINFDVLQVVEDLSGFLERLASVNPKARMVLTVSPVPLIASYSGEHALTATSYSKSVLRAAADMVLRRFPAKVAYFPAYEIVSNPYRDGTYFAEDLRSVKTEGVDHVMGVFFAHFAEPITDKPARPQKRDDANILNIICDEEASHRLGVGDK